MVEDSKKEPGSAPAHRYADPFSAFRAEIDRMFDNFFGADVSSRIDRAMPSFTRDDALMVPTVDVKENDQAVTITAELAGLSEDDVDLSLKGGMLTLRAEKRAEQTREEDSFHITERRFGRFERTFRVPDSVDIDNVTANVEKGVLTVSLPKRPGAEPTERKIQVSKA